MSAPFARAPVRQYIVWGPFPRDGAVAKLPIDHRTGTIANAHDPAIWTDHDSAAAAAARFGAEYGVGFVLTEADPYWFLDIDHALVDCVWSPLAAELCAALAGCYVEVSYSGTGLHIIGRGEVPPHSTKNTALGLELYTSGRFCALTGTHARGAMDHEP